MFVAISELKTASPAIGIQYIVDTSFFCGIPQARLKKVWGLYIFNIVVASIFHAVFFLLCFWGYIFLSDASLDLKESFSNRYVLMLFALPIAVFLVLLGTTYGKNTCAICNGRKELNSHNKFLDRDFQQETCFCCMGKGRVKNHTALGKVHLLLMKNIRAIEESGLLRQKYTAELTHYQQELKKEQAGTIRMQMEGIIERLQKEVNYHGAVIKFHHTCAKQSAGLMYNHYVLNMIDSTNQYLDGLEDEKTGHYIHTAVVKWETEKELTFSKKAQELIKQLHQVNTVDITEELQAEIEKLL